MKLASRYNRVNILTTVMVLLIAGVIYYIAISRILTGQKDKDLKVEEQEIFEYVRLNNQLPQTFQSDDQQITFTQIKPGTVTREFINTEYYEKWNKQNESRRHRHRSNGEYEAGRGLITAVSAGNKYYRILIVESKVETEDLISIIFLITLVVILLLLGVLFMMNRLLLRKLWQPFFEIMHQLRTFNITDSKKIAETTTGIDEFKELNNVVSAMANQAKHDYTDLKVFTENASHELLTPIAVINAKLDTLIQTENFNDKQSKLLNDLYSAVSRLNRLNQSLLLLVKIENNLLQEQQSLNLRLLTEEMISQLGEICQNKGISFSHQLEDKTIISSKYLIEILLTNLLSNAIRHNYNGGKIDVILTADSLTIKNTGEVIPLPSDEIFNRFQKSPGSEGSGLGLTISRQICENFNFLSNYEYKNERHVFTVLL